MKDKEKEHDGWEREREDIDHRRVQSRVCVDRGVSVGGIGGQMTRVVGTVKDSVGL